MTPIEYLKIQSKNLNKDFKTQTFSFDPKLGSKVYDYEPNYFKFDMLVPDFKINEDSFKLGNAQHIIAKLCGFTKWVELLKALPARVELAILLFDNMDRVSVRDWEEYISRIETENKVTIDDDFRLQIFKEVFLEREQDVYYDDYRLLPDERYVQDNESNSTAKITFLPLNRDDRDEFIKAANRSFERIFERIEPENPELTRALWNAEHFIDKELLSEDMLPIDRDYALSFVDSFLVGYVIQLAAQADEQAQGQ
ncbi:hypothetical protein [Pedobacter frigoris]|uniref:Uncharacterized protein n=1 Tax=Pedobacter frigoris TaxID=2571272 RepID=A0A4V5P1R1_9SPHI|nr:hypothetical protein [Pedobacter frigoris]TKC04320.1 hypothetical protein FA047_17190 [Pedobacter frigoris]